MSRENLYEKSSGVFLDVSSCGSSIRWGVSVTRGRHDPKKKPKDFWYHTNFSVGLTDCNRAITWSGGPQVMLKKLDTAIAALAAMKESILEAQKLIPDKSKKEVEDDF